MSQFFQIHPENPQQRLILQAVAIMQKGGVVAYPTDSAYALGCVLGNKKAMERIRDVRRLDQNHNFTLICRDLSEISTYAHIDNTVYKLIKNNTPGPYTFILQATSVVPRRLMHPKRKTIGIRIPECAISLALAEALGEPIMTTSLILPNEELPMMDPYDIRDTLEHALDLVIDGGYCGMEPTTVIDMTEEQPVVIREGKGDIAPFTF